VELGYQLLSIRGASPSFAQLEVTISIFSSRLSTIGGCHYEITAEEPDQVQVVIHSSSTDSEVSRLLGQTGSLRFVLLPPETYGDATTQGSVAIPAQGTLIDPNLPTQFMGDQLDSTKISDAVDPNNPGYWLVNFAFTKDSANQFSTWSAAHVNDYFAIVLDGVVLSAPYIKSQIADGRGQITGSFTAGQAKTLAVILKCGALPFPAQEVSSQAVP
jgi:preprotein translocase subunit SecD